MECGKIAQDDLENQNKYMLTKEQEYQFADSEHLAGWHNTYQKDCSECYKENRLLKSKMIVTREMKEESRPRYYQQHHGDDPRWNTNPIQ